MVCRCRTPRGHSLPPTNALGWSPSTPCRSICWDARIRSISARRSRKQGAKSSIHPTKAPAMFDYPTGVLPSEGLARRRGGKKSGLWYWQDRVRMCTQRVQKAQTETALRDATDNLAVASDFVMGDRQARVLVWIYGAYAHQWHGPQL